MCALNCMAVNAIVEIFYSKPHCGTIGTVRGSPKPAGYFIWGPQMSAHTFVPTHQADAEIFHRIIENFDLLVAPDGRPKDHQIQ